MKTTIQTFLLLASGVLLLGVVPSRACDACNIAFGQQMQTSRADSLIGRDFAQAVANQGQLLAGSGLGSDAFQPQGATSGEVCENCPDFVKKDPGAAAPFLLAINERAPVVPELETASSSVERPNSQVPVISARGAGPVSPPAGPTELRERFGGSYGTPYDQVPEEWKSTDFIEIVERDYALPIPATSFVPQDTKPDKTFTITLSEGKAYIGNGVVYDGFLTDGTVPGPLIEVDEGDIVEFIVENKGTIPHGASIHSAYTQTSKYLGKINPGDSGRVVFRCTLPGVYMYHCAPGGHAIPMHVLFGQYGMMVVHPKKEKYVMDEIMGQKPDIEIYLLQHEFYANGKDAVEGLALYTTFNGKLFRYVEEPIKARPGDFVRIYFLNVGPNLLSTFHIVGIIWDYVYWQGNPAVALPGGQSVTAGPTDSWVIDFRIPPDEGAYTMLTHAVGSASRGAIGLIVAEKDAERTARVTPEGLQNSPEEMEKISAEAVRTISPFKFTDHDQPVRFAPGIREVDVSIIGNSYSPKVIEVEPGTKVTWTNEDVFTYLAGEFAGIHNAAGGDGEDIFFVTELLAHGEQGSFVFEKEGEYEYMCAPHPYMKGKVIVKKPEIDLASLGAAGDANTGLMMPLVIGAFLVALVSFFRSRSSSSQ